MSYNADYDTDFYVGCGILWVVASSFVVGLLLGAIMGAVLVGVLA